MMRRHGSDGARTRRRRPWALAFVVGLVLALAAYGSPFLPAAEAASGPGGKPPPAPVDENAQAKAAAARQGSSSPSALRDGGDPAQPATGPQGSVEFPEPPPPPANGKALKGPD